jgi:sec-independent protein translocase protein TatC
MTIVEHLAELRMVLLKVIAAIALGSVIAFLLGNNILDLIFQVSNPQFITNRWFCRLATLLNSPDLCINSTPLGLVNIELAGQFSLHIKLAVLGGVILTLPYCITVIAGFILPALKEKERKLSLRFLLLSFALFIVGVAFGYYVIAPIAVHFMANYNLSKIIVNHITVQSFIATVSQTVLAMGIGFELPLVVFFLTKWHIIELSLLEHNRPVAIVVLLILAAIITPPDVFSMMIVVLPLWLLYEISIFATKWAKLK